MQEENRISLDGWLGLEARRVEVSDVKSQTTETIRFGTGQLVLCYSQEFGSDPSAGTR
jgi:hypothetical protein